MQAEYAYGRWAHNGHVRYLVLKIKSSDMEKRIPVKEVGIYACDHDGLISDCGRCWDCGAIKPLRHSPTNWALPKTAD